MKETLAKLIQIKSEPSITNKEFLLMLYKEDHELKEYLRFILDPSIRFWMTDKTLNQTVKYEPSVNSEVDFLYLCDLLSERKGLDKQTKQLVLQFLQYECEDDDREIYKQILSKSFRLGIGEKMASKLMPTLFSKWEVQQSYPIEKYPVPDGTWFALTQKLNGIRATYYNGRLVARSGKTISGLDHILAEIKSHTEFSGYVLDGELTLINKGELSDNEAFRKAAGIINSDDGNKGEIGFTVFDAIQTHDFEHDGGDSYTIRRDKLDRMMEGARYESISILPTLYKGTDQSMIWQLLDRMVEEDKEGLILNLNVPYKRSRHRGILKIKRFYTMDLPVIRCEGGEGRLAGTLGALFVDYKGNEVGVGTGFTDEQRDEIWSARDSIAGTLCEVKYKEISYDKKTGAESLQFPVFVGLREDKTEVSYG